MYAGTTWGVNVYVTLPLHGSTFGTTDVGAHDWGRGGIMHNLRWDFFRIEREMVWWGSYQNLLTQQQLSSVNSTKLRGSIAFHLISKVTREERTRKLQSTCWSTHFEDQVGEV